MTRKPFTGLLVVFLALCLNAAYFQLAWSVEDAVPAVNTGATPKTAPAVGTPPAAGGTPQDPFILPISLDMQKGMITYEENRAAMPLDLPTVVDLFVHKNLDSAIAAQGINQAKGRLIKSTAQLQPSLKVDQSREHFVGGEIIVQAQPVPIDRITFRPTLTSDYQLDLGKGVFSIVGGYMDVKKAEKTRDRTVQKALLDSLTAYYEWIRSIYNVEFLQKSLAESEAKVKLAKAKYKNGFGNHIDIVRAKSVWEEDKTKLLDAENKARLAEYTLINKLNLPFVVQLVPKEEHFPKLKFSDEELLSLPELVAYAEGYRPDLQELRYQTKSARAQLAAVVAGGIIPKFQYTGFIRGIGPKMNALTKTTRNYTAVNIDLLQNMGINMLGGIQENRAKIQESLLQKEKLMNQIKQDITQAYLDVSLYNKQIAQTREKIQSAQTDYLVTNKRHQEGFNIKMEVIESETNLSQAKFEHISALTNFHIAKINLLYQLGLLTPSFVRGMT